MGTMEKIGLLTVKNFFDDKKWFSFDDSFIAIKDSFEQTYGKDNMSFAEGEFKKYFKLLVRYSNDKKMKNLLLERIDAIEGLFWFHLSFELFPLKKFLNEHKNLIKSQIDNAIFNLFIFSDLTLAVLLGNKEKFIKLIKFRGKGGRLTKYKINLYRKVFEKYDTEKQNGKKPKWGASFISASMSKDDNGNPLISDEEDRKKQKDTFLKFRKRNKINSGADFIKFLKQKDYPL